MEVESHTVRTTDGWTLSLRRMVRRGTPPGPPVLFVPGYGMNSWIVQYHASGHSFAHALLDAGLDPWGIDLRGTSTSRGPRRGVSLAGQALVDLPAALSYISETTGAARVHGIGCSLGGALLLGVAALDEAEILDRLALIGVPLDWGRTRRGRWIGGLLQTVGSVPLRGTRRFAGIALPVAAAWIPRLLAIYLNPEITDVGRAADLVQTVEDPVPALNRGIGGWMRSELSFGGRPVAPGLQRCRSPLLVVYGRGDQVVPRAAALSMVGATGGAVEVIEITHPSGARVGHADLFASEIAPADVFAPVARFLAAIH